MTDPALPRSVLTQLGKSTHLTVELPSFLNAALQTPKEIDQRS
jgi:hypothetical protein